MSKLQFEIEIPEGRKVVCYNYGCSHWYLCLNHDPKKDGDDSSMKNCDEFSDKPKYQKFQFDRLG